MSASARKLSPATLLAAFAGVALVLVCVSPVLTQTGPLPAQSDPLTAAQVVEMTTQLRAASADDSVRVRAVMLGQQLLIEQRYGEAYDLYSALLERWPRAPEALYGVALAAFNLNRAAEAERFARTAAEINLASAGSDITNKAPNKAAANPMSSAQRLRAADALVLLAVVLGARGDDTQALKTVAQAAALAPGHFDAQLTLGRALYSVSDSPAAVKAFRAALQIKPDDVRALFFLATALEGAGDTEAALDAYRDLVRRRPQAVEGHLGLGVLLIKRGGADAQKGIEALQTAVRIDPNLYEAQVTLGRSLLMQKQAGASVEHLKRAAELAPNNPEPHYQLALAYRRLGQHDKAVEETAIVKRIHETRRGDGTQTNTTARPNQR